MPSIIYQRLAEMIEEYNLICALPNQGYSNMPTAITYNDQQCVAALNSCLDLEKWGKLPYVVTQRVKALFCGYRIKPVCFFDQKGFGLRVYADKMNVEDDGGDEVSTISGSLPHTVDTSGSWLRCPAELFQEAAELRIVADETGRKFYKETEDEDNDEDEDGDSRPNLVPGKQNTTWQWTSIRPSAARLPLAEAQQTAARVNGVVLKIA